MYRDIDKWFGVMYNLGLSMSGELRLYRYCGQVHGYWGHTKSHLVYGFGYLSTGLIED
jgi:hypothetical protein